MAAALSPTRAAMAARGARAAQSPVSFAPQDELDDLVFARQQSSAASRVAAAWKGRTVRRRQPKRRVPVAALVTSIRVSKGLREGLASFLAYVAFMAITAVFVSSLSDQDAAFTVERQLLDVFDWRLLHPRREDVRTVDTLWEYIGALQRELWDGVDDVHDHDDHDDDDGANAAAAPPPPPPAPPPCAWLAELPSSPCSNAVCDRFFDEPAYALGGADEAACDAVIDAHCARAPSEPMCALVARARARAAAGCLFGAAAPTNPCHNAVCAGVEIANGTVGAPNGSAAASAAPPLGACAAVVAAHCEAHPTEPGCTELPPAAGAAAADNSSAAAQGGAARRALGDALGDASGLGAGVAAAASAEGYWRAYRALRAQLRTDAPAAPAPSAAIAAAAAAAAPSPSGGGAGSSSAAERWARPATRATRGRVLRAGAEPDRVGMVDSSNRAIGALMVWQGRYPTQPCTKFRHYIRECVRPRGGRGGGESEGSVEPFVGRVSGREYRPGVYSAGNESNATELQTAMRIRSALGAVPRISGRAVASLWFLALSTGNFADVGRAEAAALLEERRADGWLGHATEEVIVALNVYNGNLLRFGTVRAHFRFEAGGVVTRTLQVASVPANFGLQEVSIALTVAVLVLLSADSLLVGRRVLLRWFRWQESQAREFEEEKQRHRALLRAAAARPSPEARRRAFASTRSRTGTRRKLAEVGTLHGHEGARRLREADAKARHPVWLAIEVLASASQWAYMYVLLLLDAQTAEASLAFHRVDETLADSPRVPSTDLGFVADSLRLTYNVMDAATLSNYLAAVASVTMVLLLGRLFKYCLFHRRLSTISSIVFNARNDLVYFFILFSLISLAFGVAGTMLFGSTNANFRTLGASVRTLLLVLLGEFDPTEYGAQPELPQLGLAFFWLYIIISFLLLLNVLLAVVIDAFILAKAEAGDEPALAEVARDLAVNAAHDMSAALRAVRRPARALARKGLARVRPAAAAAAAASSAQPAPRPLGAQTGSEANLWSSHRRRRSLAPRCQPLTEERQSELIAKLADEAGTSIDDAQIARLLLSEHDALLTKGTHLTLADLTELFGAVTATKVMSKYGQLSAPGTAGAEGGVLPELGGGATQLPFELSVSRALVRIGRGVERVNDAQHRLLQSPAISASPEHWSGVFTRWLATRALLPAEPGGAGGAAPGGPRAPAVEQTHHAFLGALAAAGGADVLRAAGGAGPRPYRRPSSATARVGGGGGGPGGAICDLAAACAASPPPRRPPPSAAPALAAAPRAGGTAGPPADASI